MEDVQAYFQSQEQEQQQQQQVHEGEGETVEVHTNASRQVNSLPGMPNSALDSSNHPYSDDGDEERKNASTSQWERYLDEDLYSEDGSDEEKEEELQERIIAMEEQRTGSPIVPLLQFLPWLQELEDDDSLSSSTVDQTSDKDPPNQEENFLDIAPITTQLHVPVPSSATQFLSFPTEGLPCQPDYTVEINAVHEALFCLLKQKSLPGQTMFDIILQFAHHFAPNQFPLVDYRTIRSNMEKKYGRCAGCRPQLSPVIAANVPIPRQVFVPHYPSVQLLNYMLSNPIIMEDAVFSFQEKTAYNPRTHQFERVYGDLFTADFWHQAEVKFIPEQSRMNPPDNIPHGMVVVNIFDDGTVCDVIGRNVINPVLLGLGNSPSATRKSYKGWVNAGSVLSYPKSGKEKEGERSKRATKHNALKFRHSVLETILGELFHLIRSDQNKTVGFLRNIPGHPIMNLHFCFGFCIGDTPAHNVIASHHNSHSVNLHRQHRDCDCPTHFIDGLNYECHAANSQHVYAVQDESMRKIDAGKGVTAARNEAKFLSMDLASPAYHSDLFALDDLQGLLQSLPWETLHMLYLGDMKKDLGCLFSFGFPPDYILDYFAARLSGMDQGHRDGPPRNHFQGKMVQAFTLPSC